VAKIEAFPTTECAREMRFCQLLNKIGDFQHQMPDSVIVDLLVIKTRIISPNAARIKECADVLSKVQSGTGTSDTAT
jgi:hypothetical protein